MEFAVQSNYECGTKKFCKEMKSYEEALFHLHPNLWTETILRFLFCAEGLRLEECSNS